MRRRLHRAIVMATAGFAMLTTFAPTACEGVTITFNQVIRGATTFNFDGDGDGLPDVVFSTTDTAGFNTTGPGSNQMFINEPGLEGTALLNPDLRVDFLVGAEGSLQFGFALNRVSPITPGVTFSVFAANGSLLATATQAATFTTVGGRPSSFPEGLLSVSFAGTAAFALFNFDNTSSRYIIDNFTGTFGTTEVSPVPEPSTLMLGSIGFLTTMGIAWRRKRAATV